MTPRGRLYDDTPRSIPTEALPVRPLPPAVYRDGEKRGWAPSLTLGTDYVEETPRSRRYVPTTRFLSPGGADLPFEEAPTALYRLYGAEGLMYVGVARHPRPRWNQHAMFKNWWPQVQSRVVEWYPSHWIARVAEQVAIVDEQPQLNRERRIEHHDLKCDVASRLAVELGVYVPPAA